MEDFGTIANELKDQPEALRTSILRKMAQLKGLDLLTGANAFQRDGARLDAKARAVYRQQGLDVEADETITNILADNITMPSPPKPPLPGWAVAALVAGAAAIGTIGASLIPEPDQPPPPVIVDDVPAYTLEIE